MVLVSFSSLTSTMNIGKAVADQSHVTIPKGPEEVHTPRMKQIMHERKKKLSTSSPRVSE